MQNNWNEEKAIFLIKKLGDLWKASPRRGFFYDRWILDDLYYEPALGRWYIFVPRSAGANWAEYSGKVLNFFVNYNRGRQ